MYGELATYIFSVGPFNHTREDGINEIKQTFCWRPALLSSDATIDKCLVSQLMLRLISKVTLERKSSFTGKNPAEMTHQRYLPKHRSTGDFYPHSPAMSQKIKEQR